MIEDVVSVPSADGVSETFFVRPDGGDHPAVILYMDAPGIREELYGFARRIADQGYSVLLPDMYYRLGRLRFDMKTADDAVRQEMFGAMNSLSNALVMKDTAAWLSYLESAPGVRAGPVGCIGYCMSGQYVVSAAGAFPEKMGAIASLYGVGIVTDAPDSPHLLVPKIRGELYLGFAETDQWVPDNVIPDLTQALDGNKISYKLDIWPGTEHGFCFPERALYNENAAEKVWDTVFDLYKRRLQPPPS